MSKRSFILYNDLKETVELMPDDMAGQLFKMMLAYVNGDPVETDDITLRIAFQPVKLQLDRDAGKYATYLQKQRENGKRGGRPKKPKETQKTQPFLEKPKKADNDNVNDTVTVNGTKNKKKETIVSKKKKLKTSIPDDFIPDYEYAKQYGITNPELAFEIYRDTSIANNYTYADWNLAWQNACRNWLPEKVIQAQTNQSRATTAQQERQLDPQYWEDFANFQSGQGSDIPPNKEDYYL